MCKVGVVSIVYHIDYQAGSVVKYRTPPAFYYLLRQRSRPYLFSNTLAPAVAAGSLKVLETYPVVPRGKARIRTQLSAALSEEDILFIVDCFRQVKEEMGL